MHLRHPVNKQEHIQQIWGLSRTHKNMCNKSESFRETVEPVGYAYGEWDTPQKHVQQIWGLSRNTQEHVQQIWGLSRNTQPVQYVQSATIYIRDILVALVSVPSIVSLIVLAINCPSHTQKQQFWYRKLSLAYSELYRCAFFWDKPRTEEITHRSPPSVDKECGTEFLKCHFATTLTVPREW